MKTEQEKAIKNFMSGLRRRAKRPEKGHQYKCVGGPFDGKNIQLTIHQTMTFRVRDTKGYYIAGVNDAHWHSVQ